MKILVATRMDSKREFALWVSENETTFSHNLCPEIFRALGEYPITEEELNLQISVWDEILCGDLEFLFDGKRAEIAYSIEEDAFFLVPFGTKKNAVSILCHEDDEDGDGRYIEIWRDREFTEDAIFASSVDELNDRILKGLIEFKEPALYERARNFLVFGV